MSNTDSKQDVPERVYIHPTSAEYHLSRWPLAEAEYVEYVRADLASRASVAAEGDGLMRGTFNAAAKHAETYANGIESQNDVSAPVENWSDFHRGEIHAARAIATDLRATAARAGC